MNLSYVKQLAGHASHLVCLLGIQTSIDCGCLHYRQKDGLYELEQRYKRPPEEILSAAFFHNRTKQFFEFYQQEILGNIGVPDGCMRILAQMEQKQILKSIITRELFSLPKRAGCERVIELHGSIFENECPRCNRSYDISYMKKAHGVPLCESCKVPIRPMVRFLEEQFDSRKITEAAEELSRADVLLILGCDMHSSLVTYCLPFFKGEHIILINEEENWHDREAEFVYHMKPSDFLTGLSGESFEEQKPLPLRRPSLQFSQNHAEAYIKYTALRSTGNTKRPPDAVETKTRR